ncbi:MAG: hypothetical protein V7K92_03780 [Nostoc sp.]|uniref:Eco57I restriction-modification methylase domain-containing protein n=1 Tax=Nostoc sp. TaxID=1180 RepID=UPI002FF14176
MSYLTPEAKSKLSSTIRALRERLLTDLQNAVESTYRLSITAVSKAGLAEEQRVKRQRLEQWLDEQSRSQGKSKKQESEIRDRYLKTAVKLAAATLLNRLIVIKQMEAHGLSKPAVLTGGWQSRGYREFRDFAPDLCKDETEGYGTLLQLLYDELAQELPGLFGNVGVTALFPIPASTLRAAIEALDAAELKDVWLSKMADAGYITKNYPKGKADLYAVFLERGLQLAKVGGVSALVTMRSWMFISQYSALREFLINSYDLRLLGDLSWSAFAHISHNQTTLSIINKSQPSKDYSVALSSHHPISRAESLTIFRQKIAGLLAQIGRFEFWSDRFDVIKEKPLVYWWDKEFLKRYAETPKMGETVEMWQGVATTNNTRFLRSIWEIKRQDMWLERAKGEIRIQPLLLKWFPYVKLYC